MKAFFLPLGAEADRSLPGMLAALSCGAARQASSVSLLRIPAGTPGELAGRLLDDLRFCHRFFAGKDEFAFFRTEWKESVWLPELPGRDALVDTEESRLLLQALRGEGVPFSFRTDREAAEWSVSALLEKLPADPVSLAAFPSDDGLFPFVSFLSEIRTALEEKEEVRIMLMCDLTEGYAAGLAFGLIRYLRACFAEQAPFIGLIGRARTGNPAGDEAACAVRDAVSALNERNLVRVSEERETAGADAFWLLGLPASLLAGEETCPLLDWAAARILGEVWTSPARPSAGLHTREIPGTVSLQTLDQEAKPSAAFLRGAFWCLSDLFPALRSYFEHPALLRSLTPASRGGLFRRLFRNRESGAGVPEDFLMLERTFRALLLEIFTLLRSLPPLLREADPSSELWQQAVKACGRAVTLASEYDVRRREAEDSGVDKVQPVHRLSLSDTAEEELLRKLDHMSAELNGVLKERESVFQQAGGYVSRLALEDCLSRCRVAEISAKEKLVLMPAGSPEERFSLSMQERRVRLLQAAVARCEKDLEEARRWNVLSRPGSLRPSSPFAGEILNPALAEEAMAMLTSEGEAADSAARALRDHLEDLLKGYSLNDAKILLRNLQSVCRQPEAGAPLRSLMAGVFSVCGVEVSGLRYHSVGQFPAVPLLPDLTQEGRFFSLASARERILAPAAADQTACRRGLLALMILRQYRRRMPMEASLEILPLTPESSSLVRIWLSSRSVEKAFLCSLRSGEGESLRRQPLAFLLPGIGLEPARLQASRADLIPSFAYWLSREDLSFRDPCPFFSEGDREILTEQLTRLRARLKTPQSLALMDFLSDWHQDIMQVPRQPEDPGALRQRLRIACGLSRLPIWQKELQRISAYYEISLPEDPVCAGLCGEASFEAVSCKTREDLLYAFRNVPIARESARHLLESTHLPEEAHLLSSLDTECDILSHSSDDYHEALGNALEDLLRRYPGADPAAVRIAEELLEEARQPIADKVTELTWPWDTQSASVLTILTECLGPELAPAALHPFSDRLALFPARGGEILGDVLLSGMCTLRREVPGEKREEDAGSGADQPAEAPSEARPDAILPPLDPDFARILSRSLRGQSLIQPGFLRAEAMDSSVRTELTLEGAFTLKLIRVYEPAEILSFYSHRLPTLALWPSLPFAPEDWHAYYSFAHCAQEFRFTAVTQNEETVLTGVSPRLAACQQEFPLCYLISWEDQSVGAVPNLLPPPEISPAGAWTACLDFGASAASVIFTDGDARWPMQGPVTVRTLLRSPAATEDLLWREFLPAVPVSALIPGALRIFRNDLTEADLPLRDGAVLMSSSLRDVLDVPPDALYTDLKWNGEKGRAAGLYLHQVMLMAALQARCGGAGALGWRFAVPEEMAPEGRERLAETFRSLAEKVSRESGLPLPAKRTPVSFASESTALASYFRFCAPEQTRGGFMALDLGADTADLSLFLQGRNEAVRSCQLPLGLHNMLLPALLRRPEILREDFGFIGDEPFRRDLEDLISLLETSRRNPAALRQARYGLDAILADYLPLFLDALAQRHAAGSPGRTGALVLLNECFLMMLSGLALLQIAGDPLRNDFLPESMTLFLAGRGSILIESLSLQSKTSLWKILTMFRNSRVSSLNLLFSAEKKLEIPVGLSMLDGSASLPHPVPAPAAIAVRPEELIPEFLLRFLREFPAEAALLFPGVYANDYFTPFTPYGQELLSQALQAAFGRREPGKPFPALIACLNNLLDMIQEGVH